MHFPFPWDRGGETFMGIARNKHHQWAGYSGKRSERGGNFGRTAVMEGIWERNNLAQ